MSLSMEGFLKVLDMSQHDPSYRVRDSAASAVDNMRRDYVDQWLSRVRLMARSEAEAERAKTAALAKAAEGAKAASMRASDPTVTWPNHTTLVTGVAYHAGGDEKGDKENGVDGKASVHGVVVLGW